MCDYSFVNHGVGSCVLVCMNVVVVLVCVDMCLVVVVLVVDHNSWSMCALLLVVRVQDLLSEFVHHFDVCCCLNSS